MALKIANRMAEQKASAVREILKVTQQPDVISFAGGMPAPELFPIKDIEEAICNTLRANGQLALQYSTTEGYAPLRAWIANRMNEVFGTNYDADNIMITHGSQQAIDLTGKLFINEGDTVICESPTYLAALGAFKAYGAKFASVKTDEEGMDLDDLERVIQSVERPKLIYIIPSYQNPSGRTWSIERRKRMAQIAEKYNIAVFEDNPYGELNYDGDVLPAIKSFDKSGNVITAGSFSKTFCPGFRIAWVSGEKDLIRKYVLLKQSTDLQCNTLAQMSLYDYLVNNDINEHVSMLRKEYTKRLKIALDMIDQYFPSEVKYTRPKGGLFIWAEMPEGIDTTELLAKSLEKKIAFVPGETFFIEPGHTNCLRLNFSNMPEERLRIGFKTLGELMSEEIKRLKSN